MLRMPRAVFSSSFAFVVFTFVFRAAGASADTYPRQPGIDVIHYTVRLTMMPREPLEISGAATILLRATANDVRDVAFDLASPANGKGMTVSAVKIGSTALPFTHTQDRLRLSLPAPVPTGTEMHVVVEYRGLPAGGLGFVKNLHGEATIFSDNWPNQIRQWVPMIDHPYDKATGEFIITTDAHYQVVSNGSLVEEIDLGNGLRRTHWKQSVPIASWLYAVGVARFSSHHAGLASGVPLQTWVFPQDRDAGITLFEELSRRTLAFFNQRIGPYPYEKLANVQAAGQGGGMENATVIFYGEKGVANGRAPVVHEIAHQWWGNSVTERDWDDVWLSEGFATYFTLLFTEHDEGRDVFVADLKRSREVVLQLENKSPNTPVIHRNLADMQRVLNQFVYQKGGWVLHMLRGVVGADTFWAGIREYYRRFRDRNASTADLRRIMEDAAKRDLGWFFDQWLTRSGVPRLEGEWSYDAAAKQIDVVIRQTQKADPFRLPLEMGIVERTGNPPKVVTVELRSQEERFSFPASVAPADVILDPGTWLLFDAGPFVATKSSLRRE